MTSRTLGVPCLVPALCNERLPKGFKGPRKVPNYMADQPREAGIESDEVAIEMLHVGDAACAMYFTMMLDGPARTCLKIMPANSIGSWVELKRRFIQNFKDTCKQPMSILDLDSCIQGEGQSTTHWVLRILLIIHSSDSINAGSSVLMLEKNYHFLPLKKKLGRLKCHCNDMRELMAALIKYADSDNTKDPESDDEKPGKGNKGGNTKGQQHNPAVQDGNSKRKADGNFDFVANTNAQNNIQCRKGKPPQGSRLNLEAMMNQPCPKHGTRDKPSGHIWRDCYIMEEFRNSNFFNHGPNGGSGSGSHGPGFGGGGSRSCFQGQGNQGGFN